MKDYLSIAIQTTETFCVSPFQHKRLPDNQYSLFSHEKKSVALIKGKKEKSGMYLPEFSDEGDELYSIGYKPLT